MTTTALIIVADPAFASLVQLALNDIQCQADTVPDGAAGLRAAATGRYDLLVLDWELPDQLAAAVCRQLRTQPGAPAILAITGATNESEVVGILENGADDCLVKPFGLAMLQARARARLNGPARLKQELARLPAPAGRGLTHFVQGELMLNRAAYRVTVCGRAVLLTPKEFDLLAWFMQHPGQVFSRGQLLNHLWGGAYEGYEHTVNSHINRLRVKIEPDPARPEYIRTVWGQGYQFAEQGAREHAPLPTARNIKETVS